MLRAARGQGHCLLHQLLQHMVALPTPELRIHRTHRARKHIPPAPRPAGICILWTASASAARRAPRSASRSLRCSMWRSICCAAARSDSGSTVTRSLLPFALAHDQFAPLELHILHAQAQRFENAHARAIQQRGDSATACPACGSNFAHPRCVSNSPADGAVSWPKTTSSSFQGRSCCNTSLVEKQNGGLGLVLRKRTHRLDSQVRQEGGDIRRSPVARMALAVNRMKRRAQSTYACSVWME